ncbi:MAG TPA: reverse transcriptase domain-containing protein [Gemmatimonadaceae bacterium]
MKPLSPGLVGQLDLSGAIEREAGSSRNLMPPESGWDLIIDKTDDMQKWISTLLRRGFNPSREEVLPARKLRGIRPVPIWGVVERIVYRALAQLVMPADFRLERSPEAYAEFLRAPVTYAFELQREARPETQGHFFFLRSDLHYVLQSDIAAFYQYVDHGVLADELQAQGASFEAVQSLIELLGEVQGKAYGLPQLFDASDMLSEVYIDRVERAVIRQGLKAWRFNDDFRIACRSYSETLDALEKLEEAARDAALTINESKTLTYGFLTYMLEVLELRPDEGAESVSLEDFDDVETHVGSYTEDFSDDADAAIAVIDRAKFDNLEDHDLDIKSLHGNDLRLLRRAIGSLSAAQDARALDAIFRLFTYVPALTPNLLRYLLTVAPANEEQVSRIVDQIVREASLNDWQRLWILHVMAELNLLAGTGGEIESRLSWVRRVRAEGLRPATRATATLVLARGSRADLGEVIQDYENAPAVLLPVYGKAMRVAYDASPSKASSDRLRAVASTSPLHRVLI